VTLADFGETVTGLKGNSHMDMSRPSPPTLMFAITMVLALPASALAQVRVLMSGGFRAAYEELLPSSRKPPVSLLPRQRERRRAMDPTLSALNFAEVCPLTL
jgi:hypothetical protein